MNEPKDHFPINSIERHLMGVEPPTGAFDPNGDWELGYAVYTLASIRRGPGQQLGTVRVRRKASGNGAVLNVESERRQSGGTYKLTAEFHCQSDALSTPTRWTYSTAALDPDGNAIANTQLEKSARATNDAIEITAGRSTRRIPLSSAYTVNWALFDAVQRLPRKKLEPLHFTFLDNFDQVKPNHTLSFRKSAAVLLGQKIVQQRKTVELEKGKVHKTVMAKTGGRGIRVHGYDHLGQGIVPEVYWVDDQGRLLFVIAGLEAYILDTKNTA